MRCFICVDVDEGLKDAIVRLQRELVSTESDLKLVEPAQMHFTLKFIGEVKECEVEIIKKSLAFIENECPFNIAMYGIGYFGKSHFIRTLWVGIKDGEAKMKILMNKVNENVKFGENSTSSHMTIARVKSGKNLDSLSMLIKNRENVNFGEMNVNEVKLKSSILTPGGPIHSDIAVWKMGR